VIDALDRAIEQGSGPVDRAAQPNIRLLERIRDLAGWATGVRAAYETLEDIDGT
jgi:hypothetical protein